MIGFAPAKINLGLFVTGKRADGFHDLLSAFWPVGWNDVLEVHRSETDGVGFAPHRPRIDSDPTSNLVSRAYHLIKERYGISGVTAHLHKVIPMGAGLGGGSSDGTCMLRLLDALFGLNLSDEDGEALAAELGSIAHSSGGPSRHWSPDEASTSRRGVLNFRQIRTSQSPIRASM